MLSGSDNQLAKIKEEALQTFSFEIEKISNFLYGAEL